MKKAIVLFILFFSVANVCFAQKPPQVKNFTAIVEQCFCTGNNSKFHVVMKWNLIPKCTRYRIIKDGKQLTLLTNNENVHIDRAVLNEKTYTYQVGGLVPSGNLQLSLPVKVAIPKFSTKNPESPTNLRTFGLWNNGAYDQLVWDANPDAVFYNIYRYSQKIGSSNTNSFTVSQLIFGEGWTYTVTAIDKNGLESFPSALSLARGEFAPNYNFGWTTRPPSTPGKYVTVAEWNNEKPRNFIKWQDQQVYGQDSPGAYNIYRDGKLIASNLWSQYYIDKDVMSGKTYRYVVASVNKNHFTTQETFGPGADITTRFGPPDPISTPVNITGFTSNDDSVVVKFDLIPGAVDYKVYVENNPNTVKYSSGYNMVEMNGLVSNQSYNLIVEALDKFGPYQQIDGVIGPGAFGSSGEVHAGINGHGDPSNNPIVLAKSAPYKVITIQKTLAGEQVFFDNFRNFQPIVQMPQKMDVVEQRFGKNWQYWNKSDVILRWYENDKWSFFLDDLDTSASTVFLMGSHFMDTIYDGGTLGQSSTPSHVSNGVMLMSPKKTANISADKVLHLTFEVDPHFSGRRWCDIVLLPAGEIVYSGKAADKIGQNTKSGKLFRWAINSGGHSMNVDTGYNLDGSRKSYNVPIKYVGRDHMPWNLPAPYRRVNDLTEYKVGTFKVNSVTETSSELDIKWTANFDDNGKFPAFTMNTGARPKSGWIRFSDFGGADEYVLTSDTLKVLDNINFDPDYWWISQDSKNKLTKLMDAYCTTRSGAIIYKATKNPSTGLFEGDIFFRPSAERQKEPLNRTWQGLDRRAQFDLYISKNRVVAIEDGYLVADSTLPVDFPFEDINVNFTHLIYHTWNEIGEVRTWLPDNAYWINFRPFADERHWDNMGFEVLTSFPNVKLL